MWVEWRCTKCGKATVQRADSIAVLCQPNYKHRDWAKMKRSPGATIADAREAMQREVAAMREEMIA